MSVSNERRDVDVAFFQRQELMVKGIYFRVATTAALFMAVLIAKWQALSRIEHDSRLGPAGDIL